MYNFRRIFTSIVVAGGHLNPAVTVAFLVTARVSVVRALLYIVFQCLGACTGSALVLAVRPLTVAIA